VRGVAAVVLLLLAGCSPTVVTDGCFGGIAVGRVDVAFPMGEGSIASFEAKGACMPPYGSCLRTGAACDGGADGCCTRTVTVTNEEAQGTAVTCQVRATSTTGQVFVRDVQFQVDATGSCPRLVPASATVTVDFTAAPDGGAGVADGADAPGAAD
jgi:hypothetical protein